MPLSNQIVVTGAREHNLKDISLTLPRDALVVITGLSGSGKSSLAFDTIYAEGQRRYVESLSAYARQFLGQMDKPDVDSIEGLSPAISIDQKTTSRNPRSTVGTVTEIYDYLRLLWSRVGKPHCPICGRPITGQSAEQIIDQVMELPEGARFMVMAPVVRGRKGEYGKLLEELRADGFARVRIDERIRMLEESIVLDKRYKHDISVVVDRLIMRHDVRKRLADSIETAVGLADGLVEMEIMGRAGRTRRRAGEPARGLVGTRQGRSARARHAQIVPGESPEPGRCSRSPSGSPAPSTDPRWSSWSRGSSRSTPPTARASAATGWGRRWRSTPICWCPTRRCRSARGRSRRGAGGGLLQLLRAGRRALAEQLRRGPRRAVGGAARASTRTCSCTAPRSRWRSPTATASGAGAPIRRALRG